MTNELDTLNAAFTGTISRIIDETTAKYLQDLPSNLRIKYDASVAAILGFSKDRWSNNDPGWEVDHCNGRMSMLSNLINKKTGDTLDKIVQEYEPDEKALLKMVKSAMDKEYTSRVVKDLEYKIREKIGYKVQMLAEEIAEKYMENARLSIMQKFGLANNGALADPNTALDTLGATGKAMVEAAVQDALDGDNRMFQQMGLGN